MHNLQKHEIVFFIFVVFKIFFLSKYFSGFVILLYKAVVGFLPSPDFKILSMFKNRLTFDRQSLKSTRMKNWIYFFVDFYIPRIMFI